MSFIPISLNVACYIRSLALYLFVLQYLLLVICYCIASVYFWRVLYCRDLHHRICCHCICMFTVDKHRLEMNVTKFNIRLLEGVWDVSKWQSHTGYFLTAVTRHRVCVSNQITKYKDMYAFIVTYKWNKMLP